MVWLLYFVVYFDTLNRFLFQNSSMHLFPTLHILMLKKFSYTLQQLYTILATCKHAIFTIAQHWGHSTM